MGTSIKPALACAAATVVFAPGAHAATPTVHQFMQANCQQMTDKCTGPIIKALDAAAAAKKIPAKCAAGRPPKQPMALDIALWWVGHHDMDAKPFDDATVATAEKLWSC